MSDPPGFHPENPLIVQSDHMLLLEVHHTNLTIIEVAEAEILDELQADRRLGPMLVAPLSDCVAVVRPEDRDRFLQQLRRAGHTLKVRNV